MQLALAIWVLTATARTMDLPMPPPPQGMRLLTADEQARLLRLASGGPEAPEPAPDVEAQSAELEELRALEDAELDPKAQPNAELFQAMRRLSFGNPLRHRLQCAFDEDSLRDDAEWPPLPVVTDVASFDVSTVRERYDIPVEMQPLVAQYVHFFQGRGRKWFRNWMSRSTRYIPVMTPILEERGLPRDTVYLAMIESGFSTHAYSWAHAAGPWQFISTTGKEYDLQQNFWVDERRDPIKSTHAAARFLSHLYRDLGHWYLAWAGYNTGGNRVRRLVTKKGTTDFWEISEGKGLPKETQHYVPKLIAAALIGKNPEAFGFSHHEFDYQAPFAFDEVKLESAADLDIIARAAGTTAEEIRELNPELKRWCTPPATAKAPYTLRVPAGKGPAFSESFATLAPSERLTFRVHRVRKGDTLSGIAKRYGSAGEAIMRLNGLRTARSLRVNTELVVPVPSKKGAADPTFERQVSRARRSGFAAVRPEEELPAGTSGKVAHGPVRTDVIDGRTRVTYGVQSGDSLWAISRRFGCSVDELRRWNGLSRHARLKTGMRLHIWTLANAAAGGQR